jgi:VIT1/CCC1 family predicted Fe2+/Mn2+ transporter
MTLKRYIGIMSLTTVLCWSAWLCVLFYIDPQEGGPLAFILFFLALFFATWGTASLLGFTFRFLVFRKVPAFQHIGVSLRQALWFALLIVVPLILIAQKLFLWWMSILLVVLVCAIEGFIISKQLQQRTRIEHIYDNETEAQ